MAETPSIWAVQDTTKLVPDTVAFVCSDDERCFTAALINILAK